MQKKKISGTHIIRFLLGGWLITFIATFFLTMFGGTNSVESGIAPNLSGLDIVFKLFLVGGISTVVMAIFYRMKPYNYFYWYSGLFLLLVESYIFLTHWTNTF